MGVIPSDLVHLMGRYHLKQVANKGKIRHREVLSALVSNPSHKPSKITPGTETEKREKDSEGERIGENPLFQ